MNIVDRIGFHLGEKSSIFFSQPFQSVKFVNSLKLNQVLNSKNFLSLFFELKATQSKKNLYVIKERTQN